MKTQAYDLIGDIHGHHDKLVAILNALGYRQRGEYSGWSHPAGRKVIFLGDYIDRGPKVREVLLEVRGMVEAGDALAIMGNHEYNAILYQMPNGKGGWLLARWGKNKDNHSATLAAFAGREEEWTDWIEWMKRLPMFLDLGGLRAVHASWDDARIEWLRGRNLTSDDFLRASVEKGSLAHRAVENVLKGPELDLPEGTFYLDKEGVSRKRIRARWWGLPKGPISVGLLAMPDPIEVDEEVPGHVVRRLPNYGIDEPPVFFGHYWMPPDRIKAPLAPNLALLDYSGGLGDAPLVAYRWDGERILSAEKFFTANPFPIHDPIEPAPDLTALSKADLKAWADAQPIPDLPEEPEAYFLLDHPETRLIPIAALRARRDPEEDAASIHRAMALAAAARAGRLPKRAPITVSVEKDGTFRILDGTSTYGAAVRAEWRMVPCLEEA